MPFKGHKDNQLYERIICRLIVIESSSSCSLKDKTEVRHDGGLFPLSQQTTKNHQYLSISPSFFFFEEYATYQLFPDSQM